MSRFGLRSCSDSFKLPQNDKNNSNLSKLQKSPKILTKKSSKKQEISAVVNEKNPSDPLIKTDIIPSKTNQFISPFSIVCRLPLQKISGVLEKITNVKSLSTNELAPSDKTTSIKIMCLYCDKKFCSHAVQKKHIEKIHTLSKDRRCSSRNSNLQSCFESKQKIAPSSNQTLKNFTGCNYCRNLKGHIAASQKDLIGLFFHLVEYHSDKYFGCKLCLLRFQNEVKLLKHIQCSHEKYSIDENVKSKSDSILHVANNTGMFKYWKAPHLHNSLSIQNTISSHPQNLSLSSINCSNAIKNKMFSGDEPILSRLGVAQNRLPNNKKGLRLRRDTMLPDILIKSDPSSVCSKVRSKIGRNLQTGEYSDVVFRVPTRTDMSCTFDDDFYENVVSNVRNNLLFHLDGKIVGNALSQSALANVNQSLHHIRSTLVNSPVVLSCEIHAATNISSSTAFPTLLTAEQYGCDATPTKMKRSITKHSWKWKWDSFKKFKLINEGGKFVKKVKQPILCIRDLSKLDMWTQLTMRQKKEIQSRSNVSISVSKNSFSFCKEEKERLNNQLNSILDTRLLPHIILEQSEQTFIKLECDDDVFSIHEEENISKSFLNYDEAYFSFLNLVPSHINNIQKQIIILSGEWARPRCYLCMGCGCNFEKLKSLEEHKMFRHTHVYSNHYEIVGRELISSNLLRHFFIPKKALRRYENAAMSCIQRNSVLSKSDIAIENISNQLPEDESSDSIQSILNSSTTTFSSKHSTDDCDTDNKITSNSNAFSPTHSIVSKQITNHNKPSKELHSYFNCTKCNRKCNGVLDLYRHMLDCSGDHIWNMAKKRKYRYYCGSKKRRHYNKYSNIDFKKRNQKSLKGNTGITDINNPKYTKTKTPTRQRPSDAESIKKMLENLPPKRVCKEILPSINKTKKSRLLVKRKLFNSQVLKQKSKTVNSLPKTKSCISTSHLNDNNTVVEQSNKVMLEDKISETKLYENNLKQFYEKKSLQNMEILQNSESKVRVIKVSDLNNQSHTPVKDMVISNNTALLKCNDGGSLKNGAELSNEVSTYINIQPSTSCSHTTENLTEKNCLVKSNEVNFSSSISKNFEKKRSKKINDCIAMLTGKLEQKLKTETCSENKTMSFTEQDKTTGLLNINKTAKRKTCSRRIVKIDSWNIKDNEPTLQHEPQTGTLNENEKIIQETPCYSTHQLSSLDKINSTFNNTTSFPINLCPVTTSTTPYKRNINMNQPIISEIPFVLQSSISNEMMQNNCYHKLYSLQPVNLNNSAVSDTHFLRNTTTMPLTKTNIPARRQTICGIDGTNFSSICGIDMEPLDLSKKSTLQLQKINTEIISNLGTKAQNEQLEQNIYSQPFPSKKFYSNLDLLKIPQVKNPLCLNKIDEKSLSPKTTSRRKTFNKNLSEVMNKFNPCNNNIKESPLNKKESFYKSKNNLKMDEVVINHIDDAINSVINAEKEHIVNREASESVQNINEKQCEIVSKSNEENVQNKDEVKSDKTLYVGLTSLKRSMRSKTIDFVSPDINNDVHVRKFEERFTSTKDLHISQEVNSIQVANNPKENIKLQENAKVSDKTSAIHKCDSVKISLSNKEINYQTNEQQSESNIACTASSKKPNEKLETSDFIQTDKKTYECVPLINQYKFPEKCSEVKQAEIVLNPTKKQRRRRKNELAAIVADQLLESFKIDKARRDNLKKLENLAYEKSEDLLLTGMLLMSSTKRNAASSQLNAKNDKFCSKNIDTIKNQKQSKNNKTKKKITDNPAISNALEQSLITERNVEIEMNLKKGKKKQVLKTEVDNINKLKTSLESFSLDIDAIKQSLDNETKSATIPPSTEINTCDIITTGKNATILRPSILSIALESSIVSKAQIIDSKTIVSSRDPRLNKNIHKEENKIDNKCLLSRQRLRSANNLDHKKVEDAFDIEDDHYLTEIAKNVNQKIMSENEDFIFANDEFEVGSMLQEDSTHKFYRPSTSMSVRSAPNLNEDRSNFDSMDENTNTEIIDMDLDDNLSVYTSFSQDIGRGGRRRRRRRSMLFSRKPKRKCNRDAFEEKFECELCKKTFYAASSLTKHQQTLAHVSKLSEQEYLLSKLNNDKNNQVQTVGYENQQEVLKASPLLKKKKLAEISAIRENENNSFECSKEKGNFNSISRLTLNPDERLFFECCNILKGSQASKANEIVSSNNCIKYTTYDYQQKTETPIDSGKKYTNHLNLPCSKQSSYEKPRNEIYSQSLYRDQQIVSTKSNKAEDLNAVNEQNNSINSHISAVTNTTSRFKTKAAMKGYENVTSDFNMHKELQTKSRSACKLATLAEIALGNENTNRPDLQQKACNSFVQLNTSDCVNLALNKNPSNINSTFDNKKYQKNNDTQSTTSSKTIMHLSIIATGQETDKIIIPERPFKNIGLEEKETIKFQKPNSTVNLLNTEDNSMSTVTYSDRDDFDFGSISCDDDISVKNSISKLEKNNCSNSSSRATTKTLENKSLIMGRIFKNVTAKKKATQLQAKISTVQSDQIQPRADLNQIFDELRGNTISKGLEHTNKRVFESNKTTDIANEYQDKHSPKTTKVSTRKTKNTGVKLSEKRGRNFTKLQSELGMSPEELAELIDDGQRKSKRRCATNRPKKLVEMWSSDEYEEFLSTKDIFALIEEKEKEEKKRKRKINTTVLHTIEDKESSAIESSKNCFFKRNASLKDDESNKRPLLQRKTSQRKEETNPIFKLRKNETTDVEEASPKRKMEGRDSLLENFKKSSKTKKLNGDNMKISKKEAVLQTIDKTKISKNGKGKKKSQTTESLPRRKRVASEKLYYWSSSSDEDFGKINTTNDQNFECGEQYQKHGWIVGDSHKKLVTLLAIAKGNKKVDKCAVKKETSKKRSLSK